MSHTSASVKSIYSGKVNFNTPEHPHTYDIDNQSNPSFEFDSLSNLGKNNSDNYDSSTISSTADFLSGNDSAPPTAAAGGTSVPSFLMEDNGLNPNSEPISRPLLRTSTTSCLSTTATKDGIEGKKLHRHGPTPYSSSVIASMIQHQEQQQQQQQQQLIHQNAQNNPSGTGSTSNTPHTNTNVTATQKGSSGNNNHPPTKSPLLQSLPPPLRMSASDFYAMDPNPSLASIKTTNAEFDGEGGLGGKTSIGIEEYPDSIPQVSLSEKIDLINTDAIRDK
ncbi:uncharacterized protein KQ657_003345 [Scheffersomyces spartinae]|uniref:Uncharacterized protein n=1 Tax=Scheffersomyces spartinae TaxID=45513 RepID=A0A9P7VDN1_9ASCO|nr:uncharacterized protein KQ657_003345 [Scheffersomyces spartinae]KAG7195578.1 hypothetical protein KQ657_003345 [Scheffersomyces spartinae]